MRITAKSLCVVFLVFASATTLADPPKPSSSQPGYAVEICSEEINHSVFFSFQADVFQAAGVPVPSVSFLEETAVILEYPSVYDVHTSFDPGKDMRSQSGKFRERQILEDLKPFVDEASYDFVLMYSLQEVPGWIHSGSQWNGAPAMNIGQLNSDYGKGFDAGSWTRLRGTPHMNSIDLYDQWEIFPGSDGGTLIPIHEVGHYWMVNWSRSSGGPRAWRAGDPIAYLAGASYHWSWNWIDTVEGPETMPGIMYSAPLSYQFNEFDLYAMGLMEFSELAEVEHSIYDCAPPDYNACNPGETHELRVEHLVESLDLEGPDYFSGDGRRIPKSDAAARGINTLIVIIKGEDETLSGQQESLIHTIAENLPVAWSTATWGRSQMSTRVQTDPGFVINAGMNDAWSNPDTSGQGFFMTVYPDIQYMFLAWFTFDTERPDESVSAILGEPGHRWLVAEGKYADNQAVLDAYFAVGGLFDTPTPELERIVVGTMIVEFTDCHAGTITYDIPGINRQGVVPIQRVWAANAELCEALQDQLLQE